MSNGGQPLPPPQPGGVPVPPSPWWKQKRWKLPVWGWIAIATGVLVIGIFGDADDELDDETADASEVTVSVEQPTETSTATTSAPTATTTTIPPSTTTTTTIPPSTTTTTTIPPSTTTTTTSTSTTTTTTSTTSTTTTSTTTISTTVAPTVEVSVTSSELTATLDGLVVAEEPARVGYDRSLFRHWNDVNGSGCDARQDALDRQIIGLPQRDLVNRCVIVEGDWYSIFDGVSHAGSPSELDVDHVVALAEAWDSGAADWTTDQRQQFANDPINLIVVTASSNRSKGDRDASEWKPDQRDAWCIAATMMVLTKERYSLTIDTAERNGLLKMVATCDDGTQLSVPGLVLPGTSTFDELPPVVTAPPTTATIAPAAELPPADDDCAPGQININTASEQDVQQIIHIGPARAPDLIGHRPYTSVQQLSRISGIAEARIADIIAQDLACT